MHSMLQSTKEMLHYIAEELGRRLLGSKIPIVLACYRDYPYHGDGCSVSEVFSAETDPEKLRKYLAEISATGGGGDCAEAVERGLEDVLNDPEVTLVALVGDEPPHNRDELARDKQPEQRTAREIVAGDQKKRPVFTCVVPGHPAESRTRKEFAEIAEASGGQTAALKGSDGKAFAEIVILAVLAEAAANPEAAIKDYVKSTSGMSEAAQGVARKLLTSGSTSLEKRSVGSLASK
ncbi:MAG: hypothetical protein V1821_02980 [bacterium]